jgi:hypothetical protein
MAVTIKSFGNDSKCNNPLELDSVLIEKYTNKSVSIISKQISGLNKVTYVDVQPNGSLIGSYDKKVIATTSFIF